jgi:hypothetical protein
MYKINTLAQVGTHVSHQERAALPSPAFLFYVCMSVCVLFLFSPPLLVKFTQHTHTGHRHILNILNEEVEEIEERTLPISFYKVCIIPMPKPERKL